MQISIQLEKHLPNLIDKPVNYNDAIVGRVIEYDEFTGMASIEMLNTPNKWSPMTQDNYYSCSSRK